jgi:MYXO-CTERM domain-containing protein
MLRAALPFAAALGLLLAPATGEAFCGFYVASAGADALSNQATVVVLMRDGTRTVLSMRNNYQGLPRDFALVVPVPSLLVQADVNVIDTEVFERVDRLSAPRLVEYWERDPCYVEEASCAGEAAEEDEAGEDETGVEVQAAFAVGEYEIVILSASDSTGLETWLQREHYAIPSGAEPLLRPYVESGSKFFVARVDASKVAFDEQGRTMLSPLRISYQSPEFSLPVRLGLINATPGHEQDLLVHILARGTRYQVANYDNVAIPTNLDVEDEVRHGFGSFYAALFDHTLAQHPNAVITEYAWSAASCDPCPDAPLSVEELFTFGADLLPEWKEPGEFVLTRLHARYDATSLAEDLVFEVAPPLVGGRERLGTDKGLEQGAVEDPDGENGFQARYAIRHPWTRSFVCESPKRGVWTGRQVQPPEDLTFVERDADLAALMTEGAAKRIASEVAPLPPRRTPEPGTNEKLESGGCAHCSADPGPRDPLALLASFGMLGLLGNAARRKPRDR